MPRAVALLTSVTGPTAGFAMATSETVEGAAAADPRGSVVGCDVASTEGYLMISSLPSSTHGFAGTSESFTSSAVAMHSASGCEKERQALRAATGSGRRSRQQSSDECK
eukprot:4929908-Prymnesium_polylepis.1